MNDIHNFLIQRFVPDQTTTRPIVCTRGGRNDLVNVFAELKYNTGVEIGTHDGHFSQRLCMANPELKLTCVDPYVEYWEIGQSSQERHYQRATEKLTPLGVNLIRMTSMEAVGKFEDGSLDFVYIDGNHQFDYFMMDLICWTRKIRKGGMVSGHDYFFIPDIARAVQVYVDCHGINYWYVLREYYSRHRIATGTFLWVV